MVVVAELAVSVSSFVAVMSGFASLVTLFVCDCFGNSKVPTSVALFVAFCCVLCVFV